MRAIPITRDQARACIRYPTKMAKKSSYYKERAARDPAWVKKERERVRKYKEKNREKILAYHRQYNPKYHNKRFVNEAAYRDERFENAKDWQRRNRDRHLKQKLDYYRNTTPTAGVRNAVSKLRSGDLTLNEFVGFYSSLLARADEVKATQKKTKTTSEPSSR